MGSSQRAGRRVRSRSIQTRKRRGTSLESRRKHLPQRARTTGPRRSAAPRLGCC
jgi:hypothetical protein